MTPELARYLALEHCIDVLDRHLFYMDADELRDLADNVWISLTDEERKLLKNRGPRTECAWVPTEDLLR